MIRCGGTWHGPFTAPLESRCAGLARGLRALYFQGPRPAADERALRDERPSRATASAIPASSTPTDAPPARDTASRARTARRLRTNGPDESPTDYRGGA